MADIYVRPYGERPRKPWIMIVGVTIAVAISAALWLWLIGRPEKAPKAPREKAPVEKPVREKESPKAPEQPAPSSLPASDANQQAQQLFVRAQSLAGSGQLTQAIRLLDEVMVVAADENLKNSALRVQGRLNIQLFLSDAPTPEKKVYVIQPGDSLDKIARNNKTTVDLIRKINNIDGNLIYPGRRLLLPAAPLVIKVDKSDKTLDLTLGGKLLKRYAVGLGRYGKTPLGTFRTVVHQTNPDWTPPGGGIVPFGDPLNVLGTRWISILDSDRPEIKGFGIHGTSQRDSIGGETSNGCVRMLNEDVEELFMLIPRGTEVIISE